MAITDTDDTRDSAADGDAAVVAIGSLPRSLIEAWNAGQRPWFHCAGINEAVEWLEAHGGPAHEIWLCASRPGQFSQAHVDLVLDRWPMLSLVYVADAWCEGELRSGWPLQGVQRRLLPEVIDELAREFRCGAAIQAWQPRTAQSFEQWLISAEQRGGVDPQRILVRTAWRESWLAIEDCLAIDGHQAQWWQPPARMLAGDFDTLIVDFDFGIEAQSHGLLGSAECKFRRRIAVVGFPRHQDAGRLSALGFTHVIAKPFRIDTLLQTVSGTNEPPAVAET